MSLQASWKTHNIDEIGFLILEIQTVIFLIITNRTSRETSGLYFRPGFAPSQYLSWLIMTVFDSKAVPYTGRLTMLVENKIKLTENGEINDYICLL